MLEFRDALDAEFAELRGAEALAELRRNRWDASASRSDETALAAHSARFSTSDVVLAKE